MVYFNVNRDTFLIYIRVLRTGGMWPLDFGNRGSDIILAITLMFEVLNTMIVVIPLLEVTHKSKTAELLSISWHIFVIMQRLIYRINGSGMILLIKSTIDDWLSTTNPNEREIMEHHDKLGSIVFPIRLIVGLATSVVPMIFSSTSKNTFEMLVQKLIGSADKNSTWDIAITLFCIMVNSIRILQIGVVQMLFWSFAMHLSSQYKILKIRFEELLLIKNKKESHLMFCHLTDRHNQLLNLNSCLENSFGFFIGFHLMEMQLLICISASQLGYAIKDQELLTILEALKNIAVLLMAPFAYYYAGDYLSTSCEEIGEVFTQCNWYYLSKDSIRNFNIVIARCQKSKTLTFWKFHRLNLRNLKRSLEAIYSYISLIVGITMK